MHVVLLHSVVWDFPTSRANHTPSQKTVYKFSKNPGKHFNYSVETFVVATKGGTDWLFEPPYIYPDGEGKYDPLDFDTQVFLPPMQVGTVLVWSLIAPVSQASYLTATPFATRTAPHSRHAP